MGLVEVIWVPVNLSPGLILWITTIGGIGLGYKHKSLTFVKCFINMINIGRIPIGVSFKIAL